MRFVYLKLIIIFIWTFINNSVKFLFLSGIKIFFFKTTATKLLNIIFCGHVRDNMPTCLKVSSHACAV